MRLVYLFILLLLSGYSWAQMQVEGGDEPLAANIRAYTDDLLSNSCQASRWQRRNLLQRLDKNIQEAAQALGYYQLQWQGNWQQKDCWQLSVQLKPGPQTTITTIDLALGYGTQSHPDLARELVEQLPIAQGQTLQHSRYQQAKTRLLRLLQEHGYWQARWLRQELRVDVDKAGAQIVWLVDLGRQLRFGQTLIDQSIQLDDDLVKRLAKLPEGEIYDRRRLDRAYQRLQSSGYFSQLLLEPQLEKQLEQPLEKELEQELEQGAEELPQPQDNAGDNFVDTQLNLAMASRYRVSGGVGYSTDEGMRLSGNFTDAYVNTSGHSWGGNVLWSGLKNEAGLFYKIPLWDPAKQWFNTELNYLFEDTDSYDSETYTGGVSYIEQLAKRRGWHTGLRYQRDFYTLAGRDNKESSELVIPSVGANYFTLNNAARPTLGMRIEGWLQGAQSSLASDTSFLQAQASGKGIVPIYSRLRLIARGQLGYTLKEDFDELPPSIRFYTGGDSSVRGYEYKSIGELDEFGNVQGGSQLVVGSVEFDQSVGRDYSVALFFDVGSAFDDTPKFQRGVGLGGRWYSPVGPLRIDVAYPIDSDDNYAFHISLGTDL